MPITSLTSYFNTSSFGDTNTYTQNQQELALTLDSAAQELGNWKSLLTMSAGGGAFEGGKLFARTFLSSVPVLSAIPLLTNAFTFVAGALADSSLTGFLNHVLENAGSEETFLEQITSQSSARAMGVLGMGQGFVVMQLLQGLASVSRGMLCRGDPVWSPTNGGQPHRAAPTFLHHLILSLQCHFGSGMFSYFTNGVVQSFEERIKLKSKNIHEETSPLGKSSWGERLIESFQNKLGFQYATSVEGAAVGINGAPVLATSRGGGTSRKRLNREQKAWLEEQYSENPLLKPALAKLRLSEVRVHALLSFIAEKSGENCELAYKGLPDALEALRATDFKSKTPEEWLLFIAEKTGENCDSAYLSLCLAISVVIKSLQTSSVTRENPEEWLILITERGGKYSSLTYDSLSVGLKALEEESHLSWQGQKELFALVIEKAKESAFIVFENDWIHFFEIAKQPGGMALLSRFLDTLTDYNRKAVLDLLYESEDLSLEICFRRFELYTLLFERFPRLGFTVLEGLLEARTREFLPADISEEQDQILDFVQQMNGFIPEVYLAYSVDADKPAFFKEFKTYARRILADDLSLAEIEAISWCDDPFLLGMIQMASPTSGATAVRKENKLALLRKIRAAGDLRKHLPEAWKGDGQLEKFTLDQGEWKLKAGERADPEGKMSRLLERFRMRKREEKTEEDLQQALQEYLASQRKIDDRKRVLRVLYSVASRNTALRDQVSQIQGNDYAAFHLLGEVFEDRDHLPRVLLNALDRLPPLAEKTEDKAQIIDEVLKEARDFIRREKDRYQYQEAGIIHMGLRAAKGPGVGLWGFTAGVCTAEDMGLFRNPRFKLLPLTDEDHLEIVGYVAVFDVERDGKKYMNLVGINPSVEILSQVDAKKLYPVMMKKVIAFADKGDYDVIHIPTDDNINSNRSDIRKAIKRALYRVIKVPEVQWNIDPEPYPFIEVYVVWERKAA